MAGQGQGQLPLAAQNQGLPLPQAQNQAQPAACDIPGYGVVDACLVCSRRVARIHVELGNPANAHHEQCHEVARRVLERNHTRNQALEARNQALEARNQALEARNQALEARIQALETRIRTLEFERNLPSATAAAAIPSTFQRASDASGQINRGRRSSLPSFQQIGDPHLQYSPLPPRGYLFPPQRQRPQTDEQLGTGRVNQHEEDDTFG